MKRCDCLLIKDNKILVWRIVFRLKKLPCNQFDIKILQIVFIHCKVFKTGPFLLIKIPFKPVAIAYTGSGYVRSSAGSYDIAIFWKFRFELLVARVIQFYYHIFLGIKSMILWHEQIDLIVHDDHRQNKDQRKRELRNEQGLTKSNPWKQFHVMQVLQYFHWLKTRKDGGRKKSGKNTYQQCETKKNSKHHIICLQIPLKYSGERQLQDGGFW